MDNPKLYPDIKKRETLNKIRELSAEEAYDRYFTENLSQDMSPEEVWATDAYNQLNLKNPLTGTYLYPFIRHISYPQDKASPFNYIGSVLQEYVILNWLPKDKKINAENFMNDLEELLRENKDLANEAGSAEYLVITKFIANVAMLFERKLNSTLYAIHHQEEDNTTLEDPE